MKTSINQSIINRNYLHCWISLSLQIQQQYQNISEQSSEAYSLQIENGDDYYILLHRQGMLKYM